MNPWQPWLGSNDTPNLSLTWLHLLFRIPVKLPVGPLNIVANIDRESLEQLTFQAHTTVGNFPALPRSIDESDLAASQAKRDADFVQ
jgi:hypothetical protein